LSAQRALSKILRDVTIDIQDIEAEHSLQYRNAVRKEGIVSMLVSLLR
jgi:hypothetical protein